MKRGASRKGCGALISVPVVCEDIDPGASKLITRPDEHECGFLLNNRCALWTRAASRRHAHPADSSALKHTQKVWELPRRRTTPRVRRTPAPVLETGALRFEWALEDRSEGGDPSKGETRLG